MRIIDPQQIVQSYPITNNHQAYLRAREYFSILPGNLYVYTNGIVGLEEVIRA